MKFPGKILMIGFGSVAQCVLPLLEKLIDMPLKNLTIMDYVDNRHRSQGFLPKGVKYVLDRVSKENYKKLLPEYVGSGDIIVDLAWDIDTCEILQWCHDHNVRYINASVELWSPYKGMEGKHPTELTLYARQMVMRDMISKWENKKGASAVLDHGANPGLVSHFTKQALKEIAEKILKEKKNEPRKLDLEQGLQNEDFPKLAQLIGLKTIHISERDYQIISKPKEVNEFVNTWSIAGFYEESVAPAELGWGTHERFAPKGAMFHKNGPKNQICLQSKGMKTRVRSWVPCGEITGMVIRHGEAFSISEYLTVWDGDKAIYRPTVHYAYCPSDPAINSVHELEMRQYELQEKQRIVTDEIISGQDELGCLLMGHDFNSWWIGSILSIGKARKLVPGQNATTVQVAIGVVAALDWMIRNPNEGVCLPDQLPYKEIIDFSKPYLGDFISTPVDWTPLKDRKNLMLDYKFNQAKPEDVWQFTTFLIDPFEIEPVPSGVYEEVRV